MKSGKWFGYLGQESLILNGERMARQHDQTIAAASDQVLWSAFAEVIG
jgi:hypothetical protein